MNTIDKVKLYPFSPLKLLHETRKLTAAQTKFFVALMCLYFEKYGMLDWYNYGQETQGAEEKNAAHYAPYCGVTKKTFIKMIDVLETTGVIYINDRGCITPIIAQEIREAVKQGTHQILECGETDAGVRVETVETVAAEKASMAAYEARRQKKEEDGKVVSAEMFRDQEAGETEQNYQTDDDVKSETELTPEERAAYIKRIDALAVAKAREIGKDDDWFDSEAKFDIPYEERLKESAPMAQIFYEEERRKYLEDERMPEYYATGMAAQDTFNMLCKGKNAYDFALIDTKQFWRNFARETGERLDNEDNRMMKKGMVWDKNKLKFVKKDAA